MKTIPRESGKNVHVKRAKFSLSKLSIDAGQSNVHGNIRIHIHVTRLKM